MNNNQKISRGTSVTKTKFKKLKKYEKCKKFAKIFMSCNP